MGGVITIVTLIRVTRMLIRGLVWRRDRRIIMAKGLNNNSIDLFGFFYHSVIFNFVHTTCK